MTYDLSKIAIHHRLFGSIPSDNVINNHNNNNIDDWPLEREAGYNFLDHLNTKCNIDWYVYQTWCQVEIDHIINLKSSIKSDYWSNWKREYDIYSVGGYLFGGSFKSDFWNLSVMQCFNHLFG